MKLSGRRVSLRGIRTFCVAARNRTLRLAAEELFITPSAVSHQVKKLEGELRVQLFERRGRSLELTPAGRTFYNEVSLAIDRIDNAAARVQAQHARSSLKVSVQPFFAGEMLGPRLQDFLDRHPDLDVRLDASDDSTEVHPAAADISIRLFSHAPDGLASDLLFPLSLVPACAPDFASRYDVTRWSKSTSIPLVVHSGRPEAWQAWSIQSGVRMPDTGNLIRLDSMSAVVRAAERGLGAALVPLPLAAAWFEQGLLVRLSEHVLELPDAYYLVNHPNATGLPGLMAFRRWVLKSFTQKK